MHASMSIFNAFCDRVPIIIIGATGPVDSEKRRPWIDWIHTSQDQGSLIRNFTKWDGQPASVNACIETIYRSAKISNNSPKGPVYVCLDVSVQEEKIKGKLLFEEPKRYYKSGNQSPSKESLVEATSIINSAENILLLSGRSSGKIDEWKNRINLAEKLDALVFTDRKTRSSFPTNHPLYRSLSIQNLSDEEKEIFIKSDVIISLDWIDLSGILRMVWGGEKIKPKIISASVDIYNHNGWSMDHQGLPPIDVQLLSDPDVACEYLLKKINKKTKKEYIRNNNQTKNDTSMHNLESLSLSDIAESLKSNSKDKFISFLRLPGGWEDSYYSFESPLSFLGYDGGGGIGSGPGMSIGGALAIKDLNNNNIIPVAIIGDGDYLMGVNAYWTAAHYKIPLLTIVANNRSYFNDEVHQYNIAVKRNREKLNSWIGQKIIDPEIDLSSLAKAQGLIGYGPITNKKELDAVIIDSLFHVINGEACVIDVHIGPRKNIK